MPKDFKTGLESLGNGCFAWIQHDGGWGLANSGLISDSGQSLIVDTLYDHRTTRVMLDAYRDVHSTGFDVVVNTHANGDHTYGNDLVHGARIITSRAAAEDMPDPTKRAALLRDWEAHGHYGAWVHETYAEMFDFEGIAYAGPTETFDEETTLTVGTRELRLRVLGPAHTRGDLIVYSPSDRVVYTGDLLFADAHPAIWAGPVGNWIAACDYIEGLDVDVIVPGHGALSDKTHVRAMRDYLVYVRDETRARYDAGLSEADCVAEISLENFRHWREAERIVLNVNALYHEFSGGTHKTDKDDLFRRLRAYTKACACCGGHHHGDTP